MTPPAAIMFSPFTLHSSLFAAPGGVTLTCHAVAALLPARGSRSGFRRASNEAAHDTANAAA